jgi:hypothetical protein
MSHTAKELQTLTAITQSFIKITVIIYPVGHKTLRFCHQLVKVFTFTALKALFCALNEYSISS